MGLFKRKKGGSGDADAGNSRHDVDSPSVSQESWRSVHSIGKDSSVEDGQREHVYYDEAAAVEAQKPSRKSRLKKTLSMLFVDNSSHRPVSQTSTEVMYLIPC
jgi:hypothetical protein